MILEATASTFGFTVDDLCGPSRRRPLVIARQIGMYVFREMTDFSYPGHRPGIRGPGPHHRDARRREDLLPHEGAPPDLRPGDRTDPAHQERCMTLWGRGPALWIRHPALGDSRGAARTVRRDRWTTGGRPVDDQTAPGLGRWPCHPQSTTPITVTVRIQFFKEQGALCEVPL